MVPHTESTRHVGSRYLRPFSVYLARFEVSPWHFTHCLILIVADFRHITSVSAYVRLNNGYPNVTFRVTNFTHALLCNRDLHRTARDGESVTFTHSREVKESNGLRGLIFRNANVSHLCPEGVKGNLCIAVNFRRREGVSSHD